MHKLALAFAAAHIKNGYCAWSPGVHGVHWLQCVKPEFFAIYMEAYILEFYRDI